MISKDESIVTQVAAKIASELTRDTQTDGTLGDVQATYIQHFDFVRELLVSVHEFPTNAPMTNSPIVPTTNANTYNRPSIKVTQVTPTQTMTVQDIAQSFDASYETGSGIQVKGTQHGPLPAWLISACSKVGVTEVWDNRDTANAENRRPLFKAVNGPVDAKGNVMAFWAPRK